jgi:REP element-mobilizing transposase RayT
MEEAMPRRVIPFAPDVYYHIYNRGNNREAIFFEPENYLYFVKKIKEYLVPVADVLVYCLMPTHYHIVGRARGDPQTSEVSETSEVLDTRFSKQISTAMMRLSVSYTKAVNKRFQRTGVLFQGQFHAKPVMTSEYLLNLCRYIHANPVKDGIAADISQWPYSNYLEWIQERNGTLVNHEFIREYFDSPAEYREFVLEYLKSRQLPDDVRMYLDSLDK